MKILRSIYYHIAEPRFFTYEIKELKLTVTVDRCAIFSLSNYSSAGESSLRSSLNDSGVFGDDLDSVSQDKLRVQVSKGKETFANAQ